MHHGTGKYIGILLAAKVKAIDLSGVAPLMEGLCGLVVLQTLGNCTVYHHLLMTTAGRNEGQKREISFKSATNS